MEMTKRNPDLLTAVEAAAFLDLTPNTLAVFRCTGRHALPFLKIGGNVRYRRSDLEAWMESRLRTATE